jgi:hypothetical protein
MKREGALAGKIQVTETQGVSAKIRFGLTALLVAIASSHMPFLLASTGDHCGRNRESERRH